VSAIKSAQICRYAEEPERFLSLLSHADCPFADSTSFALAARYYETYFGESHRGDVSFIVHRGDVPLAFVRAQATGNVIADNGQSIVLFRRSDEVAETTLFDLLEESARRCGVGTLKILDASLGAALGTLGRHLLNRRAVPVVRLQAVADLTIDEGALKGGLRKSYRSLVNWGLRELRYEFLTASAFDPQAFESFRAFHIRTSGRETRSRESWDIQAEMIRAGRGELVLSHLDEHGLVGGSLFLDTGTTTTYGVGVYERSLFDKPLAHAALFTGILRAKARGQRRFVVGDVPAASAADDKAFSIGQFKSGLTSNLFAAIEWTVAARPAAAPAARV
jgi:hypothetical protein